MELTPPYDHAEHAEGDSENKVVHQKLQAWIEHAAHFLPAQGPITVFIHHNTLHAFEHLPFHQAVQQGAKVFGCEPYLTEERFRSELSKGRIRLEDLQSVLREELGQQADEVIVHQTSRLQMWLILLEQPLFTARQAELRFHLAESQSLQKLRSSLSTTLRRRILAETRHWVMRDLRTSQNGKHPSWLKQLLLRFDSRNIERWDESTWEAVACELLWHVCEAVVETTPVATADDPAPMQRARDWMLQATGCDIDQPVNEVLIRFCASYLDQGISHWPLPHRDNGFFQAFLHLHAQAAGSPDTWKLRIQAKTLELLTIGKSPLDVIHDVLNWLNIANDQREMYLTATLLALPGWAGMIRQIELRGDRVACPVPAQSLTEFLAIRLILDQVALEMKIQEHFGSSATPQTILERLKQQRPAPSQPSVVERTYAVFQLAQLLGWSPREMYQLSQNDWGRLFKELNKIHSLERRRLFHLAYERRLRTQTLDALSINNQRQQRSRKRASIQVITCLDEREESFRRHLEEVVPTCETFGAAGFFGVAMYYQGISDAYYVPLCPIIVTPQHWVKEQVSEGLEEHHEQRSRNRKVIGAASQRFRTGTRSATLGAFLSAGLGVFATAPLVARILFPRLAAKVREWFQRSVLQPPSTQLVLERRTSQPGQQGDQIGYSLEEMANIAERLLRDIGLIHRLARLVVILGHGSDSLNNPHKSAYDCGACGGSSGAPNGRALAQMLNDPRVRAILQTRKIDIPSDTWFIGGFHNTCDDTVQFFEEERIPATHREEFGQTKRQMQTVCERNAHERCRRFMSAPLDLSPAKAHLHVEHRSEDLAQVRPELGHATNAICIVGRRDISRGLFLDRRAFLTSYDPTQDDSQGSTLLRLMNAALPVCGGINLEYYFSHVDSSGYGCDTKLPHNVTGLVGVMDGAASDLRTGLPWQMVEIHEPVRLLFVVESTPDIMLGIMNCHAEIGRMIRNGWVQFSVMDPTTGDIQLFQQGQFVPYTPQSRTIPQAETSQEWYQGWREHLEFACIGGGA